MSIIRRVLESSIVLSLFLLVSGISIGSYAQEADFSGYEIYYGDFDGDGYDNDIYLHGKETFVLIHSDISIPLWVPGPDGMMFREESYYSHASSQSFSLSRDELTQFQKGELGVDFYIGDIGNDGIQDIVIRGRTADSAALILKNDGGQIEIVANIDSIGRTFTEEDGLSEASVFTKNISDKNVVVSISDGLLKLDGLFFDLDDEQFLPSDPTAANQNVATPLLPNMASPSLSVQQVREIDNISSLAGAFNVTPNGDATYSVPIKTAPGTAGVAPKLAFNYSSSRGEGNMGLGWSLDAVGSISRCRQTKATDNVALPITFGATDRFCLNGQRLLLISTDKAYGEDGAQYKTEIDNLEFITSHGGSIGMPDYFTVKSKDGSLSTYGGEGEHDAELKPYLDDQFLADKVFLWAQTRFEDNIGNAIIYKYSLTDQHFRFKEALFTFGISGSEDDFGSRLVVNYLDYDFGEGYQNGYLMPNNGLVQSVDSFGENDQLLRRYKVNYDEGAVNKSFDEYKRVSSISECFNDTDCIPATVFNWDDVEVKSFSAKETLSSKLTLDVHADDYLSHSYGDFNGDGLLDVIFLQTEQDGGASSDYDTYLRYAYQDKNGGFVRQVFEGTSSSIKEYTEDPREGQNLIYSVYDANGDGRADVAVRRHSTGERKLLLSSPTNDGNWRLKEIDSSVYPFPFDDDNVSFSDLNSDGISDALYYDQGKAFVHFAVRRDGAGPVELPYVFDSQPYSANGSSYEILPRRKNSIPLPYGDFNNDGLFDFVSFSGTEFSQTYENNSIQCHAYRTLSVRLQDGINEESRTINFDDKFILRIGSTTGHSQGACSAQQVAPITNVIVQDINGDGNQDVIYGSFSLGKYRDRFRWINVRFGLGDGTFEAGIIDTNFTLPSGHTTRNGDNLHFVDYDGDGDLDMLWRPVRFINDSHINPGDQPLVVAKFENGQFSTTNRVVIEANEVDSASNDFIDVNGDGSIDRVRTASSRLYTDIGTSWLPAKRMIGITNGMGVNTFITYEPFGSSQHYSSVGDNHIHWNRSAVLTEFFSPMNDYGDIFSIYPALRDTPLIPFRAPKDVVISVKSSNPFMSMWPNGSDYYVNNRREQKYYYEEAKIQAGGRGFAGFKKVTIYDVSASTFRDQYYRQDWPFTGRVHSTEAGYASFSGSIKLKGGLYSDASSSYEIVGVQREGGSQGLSLQNVESIIVGGGTGSLGPLLITSYRSEDRAYKLREASGLQGDVIRRVVTENEWDSFGNALKTTISHYQGDSVNYASKVETANGYGENEWSKRFGRLQESTVVSRRSGKASKTRHSKYQYAGLPGEESCELDVRFYGMLCVEVTSPNAAADKVIKSYYYDDFGNESFVKTVSADGTRVSELSEYDTRGRFVEKTFGAFRSDSSTYSSSSNSDYTSVVSIIGAKPHLMSEVIERDIHGIATHVRSYIDADSSIDAKTWLTPAGTIYFASNSLGEFTLTRPSRENLTNCPYYSEYAVTTNTAGGGESKECFDLVGRAVRSLVKGFNNQDWIATDVHYDILGRERKNSEPYYIGESKYWTENKYDRVNRVTETILPIREVGADGNETSEPAKITITYDGLTVTATNPRGQTKTEVRNIFDEVISVTTIDGTTRYEYDALGNMDKMIDAEDNRTIISYDHLDRKISMSDPDKGYWEYKYTAYGELKCQEDAVGNTISNKYDFLGRLVERIDRSSGGSCINPTGTVTGKANWQYDTAPNGIGSLDWESDSETKFVKSYAYDRFGRESALTTQFPGADNQLSAHFEKTTYDQFGRVFQVFDAARNSASFKHNGIQNHYNAAGYFYKVTDAAQSGSSTVYSQVLAMDARGNVKQANYADGVIAMGASYNVRSGLLENQETSAGLYTVQNIDTRWDHVGNLLYRHENGRGVGNSGKNLKETFGYDGANRLDSYVVRKNSAVQHSVSLQYTKLGNIQNKSDVGSANYIYGSSKPHAVTQAGGRTYNYNANGSMTSDTSGRTIDYSVFDKPYRITVAGKNRTEFFYDTSRARFKRVDTNLDTSSPQSGAQTVTLYVGGVEKVFHPDNKVTWRRVIGGMALITHEFNASGSETSKKERYLIKDHLGSVNFILGASGQVEEEMAFDPWGKRRATENWTQMSESVLLNQYSVFSKPITQRGFTGHEMVDEAGIIHMNGRIYDPHLGRFLQADPYIQEPTTPGSLNRYSYILNNPLNGTDPSGYIFGLLVEIAVLGYIGSQNETLGALINFVGTAVIASTGCVPCAAAWSGLYTASVAKFSGATATEAFTQGVTAGATTFVSVNLYTDIGAGFDNDFAWSSFFDFGVKQGFWHIASHAFLGGALAGANGGDIGSGALSGGLTKAFNVNSLVGGKPGPGVGRVVRVSVAAALGGTISERTGGKFASGALTAAFAQMYNNEKALSEVEEYELRRQALATTAKNIANGAAATGDVAEQGFLLWAGGIFTKAFGRAFSWARAKFVPKSAAKLCFVEGTLVHTQDGLKPIEEIQVGDLVASKDEFTGETTWKPVSELFRNKNKSILNVTLVNTEGEEELLGVTAEHPFWVDGQGWVDAGELHEGQIISSVEGDVLTVNSIVPDEQLHDTYNFEVADYHTYFVGEQGAWVHNQCNAVYKTTKEAKQAAEKLGFNKINETIHDGQAVFKKGKRFITRDVDGHNGGAWKMAKSVKGLGSKDTRLGTFDKDLNRIGD